MATNKRLIKSNDEGGGGASFNTVLHTPNNTGNSISLTGVGFQPDFVWMKYRYSTPSTGQHYLFNSVTGDSILKSNSTQSEISGYIQSFDPDGVTYLDTLINRTGTDSVVAWCWKAGGAAVTNTAGTITSQVSANTEAGFSVVSYTGNDLASQTYGHGLTVEPKVIITKRRSGGNAQNWCVYHSGLTSKNYYLELNTTNQELNGIGTAFNSGISSSVVGIGNSGIINDPYPYISYCFAEVEGFSNFGSYVGTGASGNSIVTGFEPAFVMIKRTDASGYNWVMYDNKRSISNPIDDYLNPNTSDSETTNDSSVAINFLYNGFEIPSTSSWAGLNASGGSYIYMAFANQF